MSFDIFVQDIPAEARALADIPDDFEPKPIGARHAIVAAIRKVAPEVDFSRPDWGTVDGEGYSIEVSISLEDPVTSFALHLRGSESGIFLAADILRELGLRAFAPESGSGLFEPDTAGKAYSRWRAYRDRLREHLSGPTSR